jgi:zinc protease
VVYNRGTDYWPGYAQKVRAMTLADVHGAAKKIIQPTGLTWVIVGDRKKIEASLKELKFGDLHFLDAEGKEVKAL